MFQKTEVVFENNAMKIIFDERYKELSGTVRLEK